MDSLRQRLDDVLHSLKQNKALTGIGITTAAIAALMTVIIISLSATIMVRDGDAPDELKPISESISLISTDLKGDLIPKSDLMLKSLSTTIPNEMRMLSANIVSQVSRSCSVSVNNSLPTNAVPITHDSGFGVYSANKFWRCQSGTPSIDSNADKSDHWFMLEATLPTAHTPGGCMRIPSFSLGSNIYAYTINSITRGCDDLGSSNQILSIGTVQKTQEGFPKLVNLRTANYLANSIPGFIRKSCSVAAGTSEAYMLCGSHGPAQSETQNFEGVGYPGLTLDILDINGEKTTWRYTENEVGSPATTTAVSVSVGSGAIFGGRLIFLTYAGFKEPAPTDAKCDAIGCNDLNQTKCNDAYYLHWYGFSVVYNALVSFDFPFTKGVKPVPNFERISASQNWMGAEGRLLVMDDRLYIYTRSTSWHTYAQVGELVMSSPVSVAWTPVISSTRPGTGSCSSTNRCPRKCVSGVYTDLYPIASGYDVFAQVQLMSESLRAKPHITYATPMASLPEINWGVDTTNSLYGYTSTTCLLMDSAGYCLHLMEQKSSGVSAYHIVGFGTKIPMHCV